MTEQKNPFEAAIEQLRFGIPKSMGYSTDEVASFRAAIKLLEAAGMVDRGACLKFLDRVNEDEDVFDQDGMRVYPLMQILNLISALPDPAKEKEEK